MKGRLPEELEIIMNGQLMAATSKILQWSIVFGFTTKSMKRENAN